MAEQYSKKELKLMIKTRTVPVDAPSWVFQKIDKIRLEQIRNAPTNEEIMDEMMEENARRYIIVKRPTWMNRFRKVLLRGGTSKFGSFVRQMFQ